MSTLHIYWANGRANFGDTVTPKLLSFLLNRKTEWADKWHTEILSIGSLLGWALLKPGKVGIAGIADAVRMHIRRAISKPVHIFGTGFLFDPTEKEPLPHLRRTPLIHAVRGRLTLDILRKLNVPNAINSKIELGDPGLFFSELWPDVTRCISSKHIRGYVPHESEWNTTKLLDLKSRHPEIKLIDVRLPAKKVFESIASCTKIFSSSLHGLIAADSLGIPNRWVKLDIDGRTPEQDRFKFDDYYSAYDVKRDPCPFEEIPTADTGPQLPLSAIIQRRTSMRNALERMKLKL